MEPITLATAVATLMFSETIKETGKNLGQGISEQAGQLFNLIRERFQQAGTEGLLTRTEKDPNEKNITKFQDELETQLQEDEDFAQRVREIVKQLEPVVKKRQVMASGIKVDGALEAENMKQKASESSSSEQEMFTDVEAKSIKLGNLTQEG
ncbi:MAG TPA: hypothetical protein VK184_10125 [Nostocaceae cyanobacterium]|nr:hypothetical protein [Nostocaceae cyanobacterium]